MRALGVDGCTGGWIAVRRRNDVGQLQVLRRDTLRELLVLTPTPAIVAVDVPIGLLTAGARVCDEEARRLLGPRRGSVFPAPLRPTLGSRSHSEASAIRKSVEGKGMSIQAFGILAKAAEVDGLLNAEPRSRAIVREVHPEVCFFFLNGRQPLTYGKRAREGREERLVLLHSWFGSEVDSALGQRLESGHAIRSCFNAQKLSRGRQGSARRCRLQCLLGNNSTMLPSPFESRARRMADSQVA